MFKINGVFIAIIATVLLILAVIVGVACSQNVPIARETIITEQLDVIAASQNEMFDTLDALVSSVSDYKNYEGEALKNIIAMRVNGTSSNAVAQNSETLEKANEQAKIYISAVREAYPDLKAADLYKEYMVAVQRYNSKVAQSYKAYARAVREYRACVRTWPRRVFLNWVGYEVKEYEDLNDGSSVKLPNKGMPKKLGE